VTSFKKIMDYDELYIALSYVSTGKQRREQSQEDSRDKQVIPIVLPCKSGSNLDIVRIFVALELSSDICQNLARVQALLRSLSDKSRLTYVDPELMHITVKFIGEVSVHRLPSIISALQSVTFSPFLITAGQVGADNCKRPQTIWSCISDSSYGQKLQTAVDKALTPLGIAPEKRRFMAHTTIARVKHAEASLKSVLQNSASINVDTSYGSCIISGMKLKKSTLTTHGPIYEDVWAVRWPSVNAAA
jgi:2'-5' RNA ligase